MPATRFAVVAVVLLAGVLLLPTAAAAQEFANCMRGEQRTGPFGAGNALDPNAPGTTNILNSPGSIVQSARRCAAVFADTVMVADYGMPIFWSLALIIVVWTGLQIMFGGQFSLGEVINLVFLIGFPWAVLTFYATPAPFLGNFTFPEMVTGMGSVVAERLVAGTFEAFAGVVANVFSSIFRSMGIVQTFTEVKEVAEEAVTQAGSDPSVVDRVRARISNVIQGAFSFGVPVRDYFQRIFELLVATFTSYVAYLFLGIISILMIIPAVITYCSYLWGQIAMLVAIVIGPIFVPMILIPQLSFLFWGWFKTLLGASVHMMIAAAVFAISVQLLSVPLLRIEAMNANLQNSQVWAANGILTPFLLLIALVIETIPIWLVALLGSFKVGELTSMIMNGGPMPSSGLGDRMRQMGSMRGGGMALGKLAGGAGAAAAGATVATGGAALAAAAVMSQATKSQK